MENQIISYEQAARVLGLPIGTLYSLVSRKQVPHIRLGSRLVRFDVADLTLWLQNHHIAAGGTALNDISTQSEASHG